MIQKLPKIRNVALIPLLDLKKSLDLNDADSLNVKGEGIGENDSLAMDNFCIDIKSKDTLGEMASDSKK